MRASDGARLEGLWCARNPRTPSKEDAMNPIAVSPVAAILRDPIGTAGLLG